MYHPLTICHIEPKFLQIFETVLIVFIFLNSTISNLFTLDNLKSTNREGCISMRFTLTLSLFCRLSVVNIVTYSVLKKRKLFKLIFFLGTHSFYCMVKDKKFTIQESSSVKHFILLSSKNKGHEKIVLCWSNIILSYTILQDDQTHWCLTSPSI